jgi:BirA family transcriptional regulator, biotin operon repressor / biotin---[acetyl-CoA-carboxylase] ligase
MVMNESAFQVLGILDSTIAPVSVERLSTELGAPPSAIEAYIEDLRAMGYDISFQKKGYKVLSRTARLLPYEVQRELQTQFIGHTMKYYESTASTIWIGKQFGTEGNGENIHGLVIIAEEQTGGTGRLGRTWVSPPGGIWVTVVLKPTIPVDHMFMVTMAGSIAVARAIRKEFDIGALIKWPNDILIGDKKVAGLLLELSADAETINYCLLSIGIDVNVPLQELSPGLQAVATSLSAELGRDVDRAAFLAAVLKEFERHYLVLESGEFETIVREWKSLSATLEHRVRINTLTKHFEGEAIDIDEHGALIVRKDNGTVERVIAGDCYQI